jgi:hypothetical protein
MLPLDASGEEFADRIACALEDENYYKSLVMNAKSEYEKRLNWAAWGESMERVLREVVSVRGQTYSCTMS